MKVPFFDWPSIYSERRSEFLQIIDETLSAGKFILQTDVSEFEEKIKLMLGVKHAVGVSDGTNAILLGLRASGIQKGDEIILPGHSFIAAAQSIHHVGGIPVPVELNTDDWLICPNAVERAITENTRAIMPVHVNGRMCEMDALRAIADKHGLLIFEDAAQALGARYKGKAAGAFGEWATFSFYPSKTLGTFGDAGALVTNDDAIAENVMAQRNHGANSEKIIPLDVEIWGTNCRLDNLHAAILSYKIDYYDQAIARRRDIARAYHETLSSFDKVMLPPHPDSDASRYDVYQNFEFCTVERDALREALSKNGIGTIIQWGGFGIHELHNLGMAKQLPETDRFFSQSLLLPLNHVLTDEQVQHVCDSLVNFYNGVQV